MDQVCNQANNQICNFTFPYDVIIAHGPGCVDGATAAWCVWRTLPREYRELLATEGGFYSKPNNDNDNEETAVVPAGPYLHPNSPEGGLRMQSKGFPVIFVFVQPSDGVPVQLIENKRVLILDLDMGDELLSVVKAASQVLLADHHDSTPLTLRKHSNFLFEECRHKFAIFVNTSKVESGATLTWKLTHTAEIPPFVQVVRIGDTWQWHEYPELQARCVLKALHIRRSFRSFIDIEGTFIHWDSNFTSNVQKGRAVLEYETAIIKQISKQCDLGFIRTNDGNVYNIAYTQANVLHSEVGSMMKWYAQERFKIPIDFCVTWKYVSYKELVSVSLRDGNPGINLASIARNIAGSNGKGGGHAEAAGFTFYGIENLHKFILKSVPIQMTSETGAIIPYNIRPTNTPPDRSPSSKRAKGDLIG